MVRAKRKKGRTGAGRDGMIGQWFEARVRKRLRRRPVEKAGRKAARKGRR